jgi:aerobic carbon-monoxide dehydrogenase large subunit
MDETKPALNTYIGSPIERREDYRFLRGSGEFVDDVPRAGLLHASVLRSPVAHGRIRTIDARAASAHPGVHAVITATDIGPVIPTIPLRHEALAALDNYVQPVIAQDKVRYVGEPVALVLADSAALAEDARDMIALDIEALPAVTSRYAGDDVLVVERGGSNRIVTISAVKGDADKAFAQADYRRREHFYVHRYTAVPMEPRGLLAEWDAARQKLTLFGAAKLPFVNRRGLAKQMGLPLEAVELVENDVGGGFGVRGEFYPEDFLIPFAARHLNRPVKWIEDRREHFLASNHARDMDCELEIACRKDGTILALRGHTHADLGAYIRTNGITASRNASQVMSGPYRVPNIHIDASLHVTNKTPVGTYRGPGRYEADFFRERLFDMAAKDLGIDRVEFRRMNLVSEAEMPYPLARAMPYDAGTECDSGKYHAVLDRALQEFDWSGKAAFQGKLIDGRYHGLALGCYIEGGASGPRENARMAIEADGRVAVYVGASSVGQAVETTYAQIAADALEIPMERVSGVHHGSTSLLSEGYGSHGSRSTVMCGSAVLAAAAKLKEAMRATSKSDELDYAAHAGLSVEAGFDNNRRTYANGTHCAHVAVDPKTGAVEIIDYVAVEDVGRIINPLTLHGQAIGAIVQGLGGTLLEHIVYDDAGQLLTGSLADYLLPTAEDFPRIRCVTLELAPSPTNPLGAKGAGEGGIIPTGGVIANAIANALGVEPNELPLSPQRVWELLQR